MFNSHNGNLEIRIPTGYSSGDEIDQYYVAAASGFFSSTSGTKDSLVRSKQYLSFQADGTAESLVVVAKSLGAGASACGAIITVEEIL